MMGRVVSYSNIVDRTIVSVENLFCSIFEGIFSLVLSLQSTYLIKHSI